MFSLTNPATPSFTSTRFPAAQAPIIPLNPNMGVGYWTNRETNILASDLTPAASNATFFNDTSGLPSAGWFSIDSERIFYSSKDDATKTLSGLTRGADGSTADTHSTGCTAYFNYMAEMHNWFVDEFTAFEQYVNDGFRQFLANFDAVNTNIATVNARLTTDEGRITTLEACCAANTAAISAMQANSGWFVSINDSDSGTSTGSQTATGRFQISPSASANEVDFVAGTGIGITIGPGSNSHGTIKRVIISASGGGGGFTTPSTTDLDMACHAITNVAYESFCVQNADPGTTPSASSPRIYSKNFGATQRLFIQTNAEPAAKRLLTEDDIGGGGGGSTVVVQQNGTNLGTASTLNFTTPLAAALSGGVATISDSGGGGGFSNPATGSLDMACNSILNVAFISGCQGILQLFAKQTGSGAANPLITLNNSLGTIQFDGLSGAVARWSTAQTSFFAPLFAVGPSSSATPIQLSHGDSTYGNMVKNPDSIVGTETGFGLFEIHGGPSTSGMVGIWRGQSKSPFSPPGGGSTQGRLSHIFNASGNSDSGDSNNGLGIFQFVIPYAGSGSGAPIGSLWRGTDGHLYYRNASGAVQVG